MPALNKQITINPDAFEKRFNSTITMSPSLQDAYNDILSNFSEGKIDEKYNDEMHQFLKNDKGEIINDSSVKDYFTDEYNKDKAELYVPNIDASTRAFISLKRFCDKKGIEVYNATRGGKLEVFPRVDFDEVIKRL